MRDVNNGWLIRYIHSNTASAFFFLVYLHIGRGLYYGSYKAPRTLVWTIGVVIFILMMAIINSWPNWILINYINKDMVMCLSLLPFSRTRTRAILRIGPHSKDVLSIIICGMLGDWWADEIKAQALPSVRFNIEQSVKNFSTDARLSLKNKPKRLANFERRRTSLSEDLEQILIGLLLGDVCVQGQNRKNGLACLFFELSVNNKSYIFYLYKLFKQYSRSEPRIVKRIANKGTGKTSFTRIQFATNTLVCFNELYLTFYPKGKKIVPLNIEELLTPLGLAYWICEKGSFNKKHNYINIDTNSYTLQEVDLLLGVLRSKFNLNCTMKEERIGYTITIAASSISHIQSLLKPIMPSIMLHKIGLNKESASLCSVKDIEGPSPRTGSLHVSPLVKKLTPNLGRRSYSTYSKPLLHPWYVTGLSDAESSFGVQVQKRGGNRVVIASFAICLHKKDETLLKLVQSYFGGIGGFSQWNNNILYRVSSLKDINNVIIPHFDKYPLLTQKRADYELFKLVVGLMNNKEHLTSEGLIKIISIKASMNNGLSSVLTEAFPSITPIDRPLVKGIEISDPNWVAGFTEGEGCFNVNILSSKTHKTGAQVQLRFEISQHSRDTELMNSLVKYWGCGKTTVIATRPVVRFNVVKFTEFKDIIVPFFNKYPLYGNKRLDYACFEKVFMLVDNKGHLTLEGLSQIKKIKAGMNTNRKPDEID